MGCGEHRSFQFANWTCPKVSLWASLVAQMVRSLLAVWETWVWSLSWENPLEKEMATHSNILAWKISWTEEPGGLPSPGLQRVRHNWAHMHISWNVYTMEMSDTGEFRTQNNIKLFSSLQFCITSFIAPFHQPTSTHSLASISWSSTIHLALNHEYRRWIKKSKQLWRWFTPKRNRQF